MNDMQGQNNVVLCMRDDYAKEVIPQPLVFLGPWASHLWL